MLHFGPNYTLIVKCLATHDYPSHNKPKHKGQMDEHIYKHALTNTSTNVRRHLSDKVIKFPVKL